MLYIASALAPTSVIDSKLIRNFTPTASSSLLVARSDRIELHDVTDTGLVMRGSLDMWGSVVSIEHVQLKGSRPHLIVLLAPPNARLVLLTSSPNAPYLSITSTLSLTPPTPSLRQAEFFASVVVHETTALVSLWIGVLSCVELELEKDKSSKRRRSSAVAAATEAEIGDKRVLLKETSNINIREHNLLHLAFLPTPTPTGPLLSFLYLSSTNCLNLQIRSLNPSSRSLSDITKPTDVLSPLWHLEADDDTDFPAIAFSCPAARRVLPLPATTGQDRSLLVMGDEYTVLYSLGASPAPMSSPKNRRLSTTSASAANSSPRAANTRRSPQAEMFGTGKKRKSSVSKAGEDRWEIKPIWRVRQGFGTVLAASVLHAAGDAISVLMSDDCGRLTALSWETHPAGPTDGLGFGSINLHKLNLGMASPATTISPLGGPYLFIGSAAADSQLVRLSLTSPPNPPTESKTTPKARLIPLVKGKGKARMSMGSDPGTSEDSGWAIQLEEGSGGVEVLDRWTSLAPIKDVVVVNDDSGAMSHLIVASGASTANSLRTVRSGVGMEEVLSIDGIEGSEQVWSVSGPGQSTRLLCSTATDTFLLQIEPTVEALPLPDEVAASPLIMAGTIGGKVVTVTKSSVVLWDDLSGGKQAGAPYELGAAEVVAAQIHGEFTVLAVRGGAVRVLSAGQGALQELSRITDICEEIASIDILPLTPPIVAVGTWSKVIRLYSLIEDGSTQVASPEITEDAYAVSLSLRELLPTASAEKHVQLLAGLSNGMMINYDMVIGHRTGTMVIKSRKASRLGISPLRLTATHTEPNEQGERIVALGLSERMSVVFESKGRIDFSSVSKRDIVAATAATFGGSQALVLAASAGLAVTKVNSLKKLSIQTVDTGGTSATRLAHCPVNRILAAGVIKRHMSRETGDIEQRAMLELRDPVSMQVKATLGLQSREIVTALRAVTIKGKEFLVAGTAVFGGSAEYEDAAMDGEYRVTAKEGRALIIDPNPEKDSVKAGRLEIGVLHKTVGPVHDVVVVNGLLAVAAASQVTILRLTLSPLSLTQKHTFSSTFIAQHLHVLPPAPIIPRAAGVGPTSTGLGDVDMEDLPGTGQADHSTAPTLEERLVVGDGMRSIFVLDVDPKTGAIYRETRDMATHAVAGIGGVQDGGQGVIISDGHNNLLTFRLSTSATAPTTVTPHASFGLHEPVVRFRPGSFAPPASASDVITPETIFATPDGRLGVIGELTPEAGRVMTDLQRNMDKYIPPPGTALAAAATGSTGSAGSTGSGWNGYGWSTWRRGGSELIKRDTAGFVDGDFVQMLLDSDLLSPEARQKAISGNSEHEQVQLLQSDGTARPADEAEVVRVLEALAGTH